MITLTSSQLEAVDAFKSFMGGPTQVLMLKGAAVRVKQLWWQSS